MKITKLQFVNRDAFINGTTKTFVSNPDRVMGVTDITLEGDSVVVLSSSGERMFIPKSAVYITCERERCAAATEDPPADKPKIEEPVQESAKKRGRKPNTPEVTETVQL